MPKQGHQGLTGAKVMTFLETANLFEIIIWRTTQKNESTIQKNSKEFLKEDEYFRKEFLKAKEIIYSMILAKPETTIGDMAAKIGVSDRQARKYIINH